MSTRAEILKLLADGGFHSGTDIGKRLGISRAAIWKGIKTLSALGLDIHRVSGRGYKLATPVAPLDADAIHAVLAEKAVRLPGTLTVLEEDRPDGVVRQLVRYEAEPGLPVEGYLLRPEGEGAGRPGAIWAVPGRRAESPMPAAATLCQQPSIPVCAAAPALSWSMAGASMMKPRAPPWSSPCAGVTVTSAMPRSPCWHRVRRAIWW